MGLGGRSLHEPPLSRPSATLSPPCGERAGRGVPIWFMVPMHAQKRMKAFHEPYPLIPSFSPSGGEGARRAVEGDSGRFMAPTHVQFLEVLALHEPPLTRPSATLSPSDGEREGVHCH